MSKHRALIIFLIVSLWLAAPTTPASLDPLSPCEPGIPVAADSALLSSCTVKSSVEPEGRVAKPGRVAVASSEAEQRVRTPEEERFDIFLTSPGSVTNDVTF